MTKTKNRWQFTYVGTPITRQNFEANVQENWTDNLQRNGNYSWGYYTATPLFFPEELLHKIEDIEIDGIDGNDYPDFCDAYLSGGTLMGEKLTFDELDEIQDNHDVWFRWQLEDYLF